MRAHRMLCLLPALLMPIGLPGPAEGQNGHSGAAGEVWPGHAAPDEAVAREGRAAMPFTAEQIEALGRLLRETQASRVRSGGRGARRPHQAGAHRLSGRGRHPRHRRAQGLRDGGLLHRRHRGAVAGRGGAGGCPLPCPGGRERGRGRRDRRCGEPPSLPGTAGSIASRQRGGQAAGPGRTAGGDASGRRPCGGLPGRGEAGPSRPQRDTRLPLPGRTSMPAIRCCSTCWAARHRRAPSVLQ